MKNLKHNLCFNKLRVRIKTIWTRSFYWCNKKNNAIEYDGSWTLLKNKKWIPNGYL
jgi:hypothetical protein